MTGKDESVQVLTNSTAATATWTVEGYQWNDGGRGYILYLLFWRRDVMYSYEEDIFLDRELSYVV